MNNQSTKLGKRWLLSPGFYFTGGLLAVALVTFVLFAHPFLAITKRVDADILVVEGWIPDYMLTPAAKEFQKGNYTLFLVSGLQNPGNERPAETDAMITASRLEELGVPKSAVVPCPAPFATWRRTSKTAQSVQTKTHALGINPKGINVITAGPHARETWVAYQHAFGDAVPVGIISIPKTNYQPDRWWLSGQGWFWVSKDFVAWLKEVLLGPHAP